MVRSYQLVTSVFGPGITDAAGMRGVSGLALAVNPC